MRTLAGAWLLALSLGGCAHTPPDDPSDPLEKVNRVTYKFNEGADFLFMRPVAKVYDWTMPGFARQGVTNFFKNLFYPTTLVNDLLQLKFGQFGQDLARLLVNSTFGVAGLFDVASAGGLDEHDEDFGQTLGYWGAGPGWYLVVPLLGPSNNRDLIGRAGDWFTNPLNLPSVYTDWKNVASGVYLVDTRARYLPLDSTIAQQLDRYSFVRTLYLQRRMNLVYDGKVPPEELYGIEPEDSQ
jgi:phospholipid-binding lipoprotein MlaA